jgi:orotate phosphoribosyltransferase
MRNVNDLIEKAIELRNRGLRSGEIADELNISRETATWLLTRAKKESGVPAPKDIFIDWSSIGKSSSRLMLIATCLADMVEEALNELDSNVDVVVGVALSGVPLANIVS